MSNKTYDILKWVATVALPASVALIISLGQIWNFSQYAEPIAATVATIAAFMGALLGISSITYQKKKNGGGDNG